MVSSTHSTGNNFSLRGNIFFFFMGFSLNKSTTPQQADAISDKVFHLKAVQAMENKTHWWD